MHECMREWISECMDGWMDGWMAYHAVWSTTNVNDKTAGIGSQNC